jgi:protein-S-isoprenylcysteine O-methyltransferase Ste14
MPARSTLSRCAGRREVLLLAGRCTALSGSGAEFVMIITTAYPGVRRRRPAAAAKAEPANRAKIMDRGLRRCTRHPSYFGDACVWWGIFVIACGSWASLATVISPLLMTYLLVWGSGKRLTEKQMAASGPGYPEYAARTSGFFPLPPRSR